MRLWASLGLLALSACMASQPPAPTAFGCPYVKPLTLEQNQEVKLELHQLGDNAIMPMIIDDYHRMRDNALDCWARLKP